MGLGTKWAFLLLGIGIIVMVSSGCRSGHALNVLNATQDDATKHYSLGVELQKKGDLDGATAEYRTALRLNPNYAVAHTGLGVALYDKGDLDGAITEYRTTIRLNPNHAKAHYNLGLALMDQGNVSAAAKELEEFIRLAPNTPSNRQKIDEAKKRLNKLSVPEK